jgi:hypothetical protein
MLKGRSAELTMELASMSLPQIKNTYTQRAKLHSLPVLLQLLLLLYHECNESPVFGTEMEFRKQRHPVSRTYNKNEKKKQSTCTMDLQLQE